MSLLAEFTPNIEVYSIDESFLDLSNICRQDPLAYARQINKTIDRSSGIPVCVGMGPSKTLAKLANFAAKKWPKTGGMLDSCRGKTAPSAFHRRHCQRLYQNQSFQP